MPILLTAIVFIFIFSLLILIHELGHFTAAKRAGVKVEEFGMGLPPRIWGVQKGETLYSINWIPFGGFVRMLGEDGSKRGSRSKQNFANKSLWTQAWIVSAGVVMNFVLAFVLLTIGFWMGIEPLIASPDDFTAAVRSGVIELQAKEDIPDEESVFLQRLTYFEAETSPFYAWLQDGDVILSVNDQEVLMEADLVDALGHQESVSMSVFRDGEVLQIEELLLPVRHPIIIFVSPDSPADELGFQVGDQVLSVGGTPIYQASAVMEANAANQVESGVAYQLIRNGTVYDYRLALNEEGRVGIGLADVGPYYGDLSLYLSPVKHELLAVNKLQYTWEAPVHAVTEMWRLGKITGVMFVDVLGNFLSFNSVPEGVSGPVGIAQMTHVTLQNGFAAMLRFVAMLSLSLGVINILPIPALDGGRLAFIIYRGITGHKPNPRIEHLIHTGGFLLLIGFLFYVTFNDVLNLL